MIDLFAGCGGMTRGFRDAGFQPALAVEHNLHAAASYAANFGEQHVHWGDIATVRDHTVPQVDVIVGGPPCQGFSGLGAGNVDDPRNSLWREYLRIVRAARPALFVIENVDRFLTSGEFALLRAEATGYDITSGLLLATDFGVPQRRRRAVVIGSRLGPAPLPAPTVTRDRWSTVHDAIHDIPFMAPTTALPDRVATAFGREVPGAFTAAELHIGRHPTPRSLRRYRHIPPGGGRFDLPDDLLPRCWREKPTGTTDVMGRMRWDAPAPTIRTEFFKPEKGRYLHPQWEPDEHGMSVDRPITHREAARLQGFPDDTLWCGSKIEIARQIGNAVPPPLALALGRHVRDLLDA